MTDQDLDRSYTTVCQSLAAVGEERAQLFLSMLCLALMARHERATTCCRSSRTSRRSAPRKRSDRAAEDAAGVPMTAAGNGLPA